MTTKTVHQKSVLQETTSRGDDLLLRPTPLGPFIVWAGGYGSQTKEKDGGIKKKKMEGWRGGSGNGG